MNLINFIMENQTEKLKICAQRVSDHIDRVKYFYRKMIDTGFIPKEDQIWNEVQHHDSDKLKKDNIRRQAMRFTDHELSKDELKEIDQVVHDHVKTQKHHCEYWGNGDHITKNMDCSAMPNKYIYELMADWFSTAEEKGNPVIDWYNKCVGIRWIFTEHQKELMLKCIDFLNKYYDKSMKRDYNLGTYIDPALVKK